MDGKSGSTPSLVRHTESIARITLRRPAVANRMQPEDLALLRGYLRECEADRILRVLILESTGKYFSSGYDIGALAAEEDRADAPVEIGKDDLELFADAWEQTPLITIAAVQGPVLGGATDLVLACDFRIGTPDVYATMPAARLGLHLYPGAIGRYVSRLGLNHAKTFILTAERMSHVQLEAMGFLNEVVSGELLEKRVMALARQIASLAPLSLRGMKAALNAAAGARLDEAQIRRTMAGVFASEDSKEGVAAWLDKRPPKFRGC